MWTIEFDKKKCNLRLILNGVEGCKIEKKKIVLWGGGIGNGLGFGVK